MPAPKKPAAAGLNWDAFPEPPPEAANWQADPDLIARPGIMKDNRFAKDSYAREKRAALRRDLRFHTQGYTSIKVGSTSGTTSPAVSSACTTHPPGSGWPTQIPRHLGVEHIMVRAASPSTNNTIAGPIDDRAPTSFPVLEAQLESTCTAALGSKVAAPNVSKSTVTEALTETMLIRGIFPEKTHASAPISPRALSSEKENIPAWAISLEKLLAEGTSSKPASASMPPPLRQSLKISTIPEGQAYIYQDGDLSLPAGSHRSFTSLEADYEAAMEASLRVSGASVWASIDHEDNVNDNVLAWQLATADVGIDDAKEGLALQEKMYHDCSGKQPLCNNTSDDMALQYQRHLNVALIKVMELELDAENRTPSAKLMSMDENKFNESFAELRYAHMQMWIAGQQNSHSRLKTDLALFQARENAQFGKKPARAHVDGQSKGKQVARNSELSGYHF